VAPLALALADHAEWVGISADRAALADQAVPLSTQADQHPRADLGAPAAQRLAAGSVARTGIPAAPTGRVQSPPGAQDEAGNVPRIRPRIRPAHPGG